MKPIDVSVVIPVYNAALLIDRCLDSVFAQTGKYSMELILVDDGSTDNSGDLIRARKEENIILLVQPNSGPAAARNKGVEAATGRYTAYLDSDDFWLPEFLEQTVGFLDAHPEAIAVNVGQKHMTTTGTTIAPEYLQNTKNDSPFVVNDFFEFWAKHNHVCTGSALIRTDILKQTGGQRPELRICEDLEFWAYLSSFGKWGFIPKVLFVSDGGAVTRKIGWVKKNLPRWQSAPTVEEWEKRITGRLSASAMQQYAPCRGKIAQNLCYSILLSKRRKLAREQIGRYIDYFPDGKLKKVFALAIKSPLHWQIISSLLIFREYHLR